MALIKPEGQLLGAVGATASTTTGSANTAATHTIAAVSNEQILIHGFEVVIAGAAAASDILIEIEDNTTPVWQTVIGTAAAIGTRTGAMFAKPIRITKGNAMNLQVAAGGSSVVARISTTHTTIPGDE